MVQLAMPFQAPHPHLPAIQATHFEVARIHDQPPAIGQDERRMQVRAYNLWADLLADRCFPAASFIRSRKDFDYIEEPDIFHEVFGHTPLLTDPRFAGFSQAIGAAGLKAAKEDYACLIRLYWFTIEFGLTQEAGKMKGLGSGLASSISELEWATSGRPELRRFDVIDILRTPYRIDILQPVYFVIEDLADLFAAAGRDLLADVAQARALGLHPPKYPPKVA